MSTSPAPVELPRSPRSSRGPGIEAVFAAAEAGSGDTRAWRRFLNRYSRLLLYVTGRIGKTHDDRMDLYTHVVTELCADNYRRLRAYSPTSGTRFSTWLIVVAQRLCVDYCRKRYGRHDESKDEREVRRRLEDLVHVGLDPNSFVDHGSSNPETETRRSELSQLLAEALGEILPRDRLILNLRFVDERSAREIADAMGFASQWQVYRRIDGILKTLRRALDARGVRDATP